MYIIKKSIVRQFEIVLLILPVIPVVELIACTAVVYYPEIQEQLSSLLTWVLSGVSILEGQSYSDL